MSSLRQIEANRRNAVKSTGPTSVTGKAVSSMNALKTGLHANSLVLPSENTTDLKELTQEYYQHHRPASPDARALVDDLIRCEWTLRRLDAAETQMWLFQAENLYGEPDKYPLGKAATRHPDTFSRLQYRLDSTRRTRLRALQALEKLKSEPAPAPPVAPGSPALLPQSLSPAPQTTSTQIGFAPSTPPQPSPAHPAPGPLIPATIPVEAPRA